MHRRLDGDAGHAPGLTPLKGQYRRPSGDLFFCYDKGAPTFNYLTHGDKSDGDTVCVRVRDVADVAKLIWYSSKLLTDLSAGLVP